MTMTILIMLMCDRAMVMVISSVEKFLIHIVRWNVLDDYNHPPVYPGHARSWTFHTYSFSVLIVSDSL